MGKYKYLANNIALFTISNFVSKILVFLLVPFYTNVLTTAEYGTSDVMQTTLLLLVPALTINMGEAALRFGIERAEERPLIFRIGIKYIGKAQCVVLVLGLLAGWSSALLPFHLTWELIVFFILLFCTDSLYEYMILFLQGCEAVRFVVIGSVFSTIVLICSNLLFLLAFRLGLPGYFISQILSYGLSFLLMIFLAGRKGRAADPEKTEAGRALEKEMLDYGKPMILYSTGAWINNAADRYFVSLLCGVAVNGIYGVAYKIPSILTVFQRIFAQAWQMSATKSLTEDEEQTREIPGEKNEAEPVPEGQESTRPEMAKKQGKSQTGLKSPEFYSRMYGAYLAFMVLGCGFLILIVRPLSIFLFRKDFFEAWRYVPPLLVSVVFGALTGFLGSICLAYKDSKAMGLATGIGAAVNVVLNALLIPKYQAMGAAIATAVSYFVMYGMAFFFVRWHVQIKTSPVKDVAAFLLLGAEAIAMTGGEGSSWSYLVCGAATLILFILNYRFIRDSVGLLGRLMKGLSSRNLT
ncbi:MAG: polysaccharide biosynthesis C-terminal domain-containing protein [Lachnospiraceae bacterium]|nr:polysaccharide biosynthesis C-terminal domain-containing protein [Lachnospiraceae bacterium]